MGSNWIIDGRLDLTAACEAANWHRSTAIVALEEDGIEHDDAVCFVDFAFAERAVITEDRPEDCVSDEQWERLS